MECVEQGDKVKLVLFKFSLELKLCLNHGTCTPIFFPEMNTVLSKIKLCIVVLAHHFSSIAKLVTIRDIPAATGVVPRSEPRFQKKRGSSLS